MGLDRGPPDTEILLGSQRTRWARGDRVTVEHFLVERPDLRDHPETLLDLIYGEVVLRRRAGERPTADEYLARFPELGEPIRTQFEVDAALGDGLTRAGRSMLSTAHAPGAPTPAAPAPPGYEIVEELGRGGMGVVYKARHTALHRLVALKVIRSGELADPGERARFEAEARAVARLSHPNVVQIYEVGEAAGRPFLALEYVAGGSLADLLHGPPFPPRPAASLVATLARAVQHAHDAGIVHRDLKPANILIQRTPTKESPADSANGDVGVPNRMPTVGLGTSDLCPKLTDFGLAKHLGADGPTQTGDFLGTPNYAAPEQAAGRPDVGPAVDVYALGAILYHLVTGRPPFAGSTPLETLDQVRFAEPVPPLRLQPNLPKDLGTIILTCLHKDPARRYPTARALADDVDRFLVGHSIRARAVGPAERAVKWARRRPAVAGLLAFAILLTAAALLTVTALWRGESAAKESERHQRRLAEARTAELLISNARFAWLTDDLDAARRALNECPSAYRGSDWTTLQRACTAGQVIVPPTNVPIEAIAYSRDGRLVAGGTTGGRVFAWNADTGRESLKVQVRDHSVQALAFAEDGRILAATTTSPAGATNRLTISDLTIIDASSGRATTAWTRPDRPIRFLVSPDGMRACCVSNLSRIALVIDVPTGHVLHQLECKTGNIIRVAFSPDGRYLLTAGIPKDLAVWDVETGALVRQFICTTTFFGFNSVAVSPDGRRATVGIGPPGGGAELLIFSPDEEPRRVPAHMAVVNGIEYSPDSRRVAAFGGTDSSIRVWDAETGREEIDLRGYPTAVKAIAFRPDSRQLVAGYRDGRVVVWDLDPAP